MNHKKTGNFKINNFYLQSIDFIQSNKNQLYILFSSHLNKLKKDKISKIFQIPQ